MLEIAINSVKDLDRRRVVGGVECKGGRGEDFQV